MRAHRARKREQADNRNEMTAWHDTAAYRRSHAFLQDIAVQVLAENPGPLAWDGWNNLARED
jgi:hypothetical protein